MATTYEYRPTSKDARIRAIRDAFDSGNWVTITPGQRRAIERTAGNPERHSNGR